MVELATSSLGIILVAVSTEGVRAVQIGDDAASLERELRQRLPAATFTPASGEAKELAQRVVERIEDPQSDAAVPLDIQGTPFQKSVWDALREIPPGTTVSYTELASRIGRPAAVRAVAHACAENAHAVLIPCHRALRSDGSLAGYRWGLDRKRELLEREATGRACCTA
jgi:AraC family transcriptional regulator of adaptative response/methylated-DNA-[protein]-cysteine methyltransferase